MEAREEHESIRTGYIELLGIMSEGRQERCELDRDWNVEATLHFLDDVDGLPFDIRRAHRHVAGGVVDVQLEPVGTRLFEQLRAAGRLLTTNWTAYSGEHVVYRPAKMTVEELYWGQKWLKRQFYAYRSIGERALRRVGLGRMGAVVTTVMAGLGYRSMFHLPADEVGVDVYRDRQHLPPQPEPIAHRFSSPAYGGAGGRWSARVYQRGGGSNRLAP